MTALLELKPGGLSRDKLDKLSALINQAKKEGQK